MLIISSNSQGGLPRPRPIVTPTRNQVGVLRLGSPARQFHADSPGLPPSPNVRYQPSLQSYKLEIKRTQPLLMQINALSFKGKKLLERRKARNHTGSIH